MRRMLGADGGRAGRRRPLTAVGLSGGDARLVFPGRPAFLQFGDFGEFGERRRLRVR